MPLVRVRYRTGGETAIAGESLAGRFIVEALFLELVLFDIRCAPRDCLVL